MCIGRLEFTILIWTVKGSRPWYWQGFIFEFFAAPLSIIISTVHCTGHKLDANILDSTNVRSLGNFKQSIGF